MKSSSLTLASAAAIVATMLVQARPFHTTYMQARDLKAASSAVLANSEAYFQRGVNQLARRTDLDLLVDGSKDLEGVVSEIASSSHDRTLEQGSTSEIVPASPDHPEGLPELRLPETREK